MSVAGISSAVASLYSVGPSPSAGNQRQAEDAAASQLVDALRKGDLSAAQQDYAELSSFGPNNSGPWGAGSQQEANFQALGQALQSGDMAGARSDATTLAQTQLSNDMSVAKQDYQSGDMTAFNQAVANYKGDAWAMFGTVPPPSTPGNFPGPGPIASGINVQA